MAKKSSGKSVKKKAKKAGIENVEAIVHDATRRNIPTAEYQAMVQDEARTPARVEYERRNRDLDPQLVWRGKDEQDWSDLVVHAPPLYIQEKVHPKVLIDDLLRQSRERQQPEPDEPLDLFADFNGIPEGADRTEFYQHDQNWTNRMILGDSLQVMGSLAEREGLRGKVQCIYIDPPYGIKFNSNFQWSTTSRDVKDGKAAHITREPEQVKAFRDTWRDGIHSYLTYLRDRLTVARDMLTDSGSVFVQIGDENVHRVRALMDEVFGDENFCSSVYLLKTTGAGSPAVATDVLPSVADYLLWYARNKKQVKYRRSYFERRPSDDGNYRLAREGKVYDRPLSSNEIEDVDGLPPGLRVFAPNPLTSQTGAPTTTFPYDVNGRNYRPGKGGWKTNARGMQRLHKAGRLFGIGNTLRFVRFFKDFAFQGRNNLWDDTRQSGFGTEKVYVVQTTPTIIERCVLISTDPGDLVLDPTCGSGTTAYVAEQWGRRWITIDTSRVALALARARIMGARYPYYLLKDSPEGQQKEAEVTRTAPSSQPTRGSIRQGFVYERVPHITLKSIANNAEIDVIWEKWQEELEPLREQLNTALKTDWQEWQIPRAADAEWSETTKELHAAWWDARIARQEEIDVSIAAKADYEFLYDRPYTDKRKVRVAGPFTVESLSPHRVLGVDENDELIDHVAEKGSEYAPEQTFEHVILENLRTAGVQQAHREARITFTSVRPWPGDLVCGDGRYVEAGSGEEKRAAVFIGPEFGTVTRPDLVEAAREAAEADFDVLIACAFNYEAHATEFNKLGRVPVLKARMNADLHMAEDLKNTGKGNLFVIFGEPDIEVLRHGGDELRVKVNGVDVFDPGTGEVRSDGPDGIACWFLDTDYNGESFFVRHAYFLGASDPYKALKTTLKAEIDADAWASLHSDTSRPFRRPDHGRVAVKVINHLGDEVMKVFRVDDRA
jgi:adenine-specific DNA-methyltransferase